MKYMIKDVIDRNTHKTRRDKFYPQIINNTIDFTYGVPQAGGFMFGIIDGSPIKSSRVEDVCETGSKLVVTTRNTIYELEKEE